MGRRVRWGILGSFLLCSGCGVPEAAPLFEHAAQVTTAEPRRFGDAPRLFSVPAGGTRLLELYLPHDLVTSGQYGPGETWSLDLGWEP